MKYVTQTILRVNVGLAGGRIRPGAHQDGLLIRLKIEAGFEIVKIFETGYGMKLQRRDTGKGGHLRDCE